ncbi:MAG: LytTR family transcriptional regulator DNA-binding domain-containing protein [Leptothrix sp. (in: b-proteobacteria)]
MALTPEPPAPGWAPTEPMAWPTRATGAEPAGRVAPVISVHERGEWLRVPVHEVLYLKAELKYVTLRTAARTHLVEASLADLEARFARSGRSPFVRVHRNALVAVAAVRAFERRAADAPLTGLGADDDARLDSHGWAVHIGATDEWLAVSRRQLAAVRQALAELG